MPNKIQQILLIKHSLESYTETMVSSLILNKKKNILRLQVSTILSHLGFHLLARTDGDKR